MHCPDENDLVAYAERRLDGDAAAAIERHIDTCGRCDQSIAAFAIDGDDVADDLRRGSALGRYIILRELGRGSMGTVFEAFDPHLDRRVALKVFRATHPRVDEAKALASLSHPNIVTVYDAGESEGQSYIAMELLEGGDVSSWADGARPNRQTIAAFAGAARGLAAAHTRGIVHGDIKPDNVLIGTGDTLQLSDFGLARGLEPPQTDEASTPTEGHLLAGTPAYMAPEVRAGEPASEASDQYALCLTVMETLVGRRPPFTRDDVLAAPIPGKVQRVLVRGLSSEPGNRFPSVAALAQELDAAVAPTQRWGLVGTVLVAVAATAFALGRSGDPADPCEVAADDIGQVWNAAVRADLRVNLEGSGHPFGARLAARLAERVDAYASAWIDARRTVCRSHNDPGVPGARERCLDSALARLDALVQVGLTADDPVVIERFNSAALALPRPKRCAASAWSEVSAEFAEASPSVDRAMARVEALAGAGSIGEARPLATTAMEEADRAGSDAQRAEARRLRAWMLDEVGELDQAEALLWESLDLASRAGANATATRTIAMLVVGVGLRTDRLAEAVSWIPFGDAALARAGADAEDAALWHRNSAMVLTASGDHVAALARWKAVSELVEELDGPGSCRHGRALAGMAKTLTRLGRLQDASAQLTAALAACRPDAPPNSPTIAAMLNSHAEVLLAQGDLDQAAAKAEESLRMCDALDGRLVPVTAALTTLGAIRVQQGRTDDALALTRRATEILRKEGPQRLEAQVLGNLARLLTSVERDAEAIAIGRRAVAVLEQAEIGDADPIAASVWLARANAECWGGDVEQGRRSTARARTILGQQDSARDLTELEAVAAACDRPTDAVDPSPTCAAGRCDD